MTNATAAAPLAAPEIAVRPVPVTGVIKVMIVDADREFTGELAMLMREAGYAVETFTDGVTALGAARLAKPDAILLDFKIDNLTDYEDAWYLRKFQASAKTPIIGMSAYMGKEDPARIAAAYGMRAFLKKPFNPLDIIARLEQLTGIPVLNPEPAAVEPDRPGAGKAAPGRQQTRPAPALQVQP